MSDVSSWETESVNERVCAVSRGSLRHIRPLQRITKVIVCRANTDPRCLLIRPAHLHSVPDEGSHTDERLALTLTSRALLHLLPLVLLERPGAFPRFVASPTKALGMSVRLNIYVQSRLDTYCLFTNVHRPPSEINNQEIAELPELLWRIRDRNVGN